MNAGRRRISLLCVCALLLGSVGEAAAQAGPAPDASRDASARSLFEDGVAAAEHGDWAEAEDRFRRAFTLRESPVIAYNLASVLATRGKLVEASEMLRHVATDDKAGLELKQSARTLSGDLSARIARIQIEVQNKLPSDSVVLDGRPLLDAQLSVDIPIDPGSHQLQLRRAARVLDQRALEVPNAGAEQVTLLAPPFAPAPAEVAAESAQPAVADGLGPTQPEPAAHAHAPITSEWWFWTGAGAVVVAAVVFGLAASGGSKAEPAYRGDFTPGSLTVQVQR